jgi:hypothetical protein
MWFTWSIQHLAHMFWWLLGLHYVSSIGLLGSISDDDDDDDDDDDGNSISYVQVIFS